MLFDNLDYNFSLLQHMFKKAKELSDEKVFLLHHITIYNEPTSCFSEETFWEGKRLKIVFQVNIAVATYEMIDKHIRKLDSDLAKFESEMKVIFQTLSPHNFCCCAGQRSAVADGE